MTTNSGGGSRPDNMDEDTVLPESRSNRLAARLEHRLNTQRLQIAWSEFPGRTPTVVFVHPNRTSPRVWDHLIGCSARKERMLTPALRGHGGTDWPEDGYTLEDHRDDLASFIDATCEGPILLCGQATGATLALMLAAQYGRSKVIGVIAAQPAAAIPEAVNSLVQTQVAAQQRLESRDAARNALPFTRFWGAEVIEHHLDHMLMPSGDGAWTWRYHPGGVGATEAQLLRRLDDELVWDGPTLVIGGSEPTVLPRESIAAVAARLPQAELTWLPRSDHRLCQDNPFGFARLFDDFVGRMLD
jgi:pimeloyl-ACP methyl ester carboxylesterase